MTKHIKKIITTLLFTLLAILLLVWIYRGFDFSPLLHVFSAKDNYKWIVLSLFVGVAANVFRAFRWRMILDGANLSIGKRRAVELVFIAYLINSVTPRLGEVTRSLLVRKGSVSSAARAFGTVVIEKVADVCCLLVVILIAVMLRWEDTVILVERSFIRIQEAFSSALLYALIGSFVLMFFLVAWSKVKQMRMFFLNLWNGVAAITRLRCPFLFMSLCFMIWTCNFLQLYFLVPCFEDLSGMGISASFYLFAVASVGVLLPTPGGAGPWHFAIVKTMTSVFAIDAHCAKLFALVTHGLRTVLVMLLGILAYLSFYWAVWMGNKRQKNSRGGNS